MNNLQTIDPALLVPIDIFADAAPVRVDVAYTQDFPKSFCGIIYRPDARLWLHRDLAQVVVRAALAAGRDGLGVILYDGLRTTEAQALMRETAIVRENPQWLEGDTRMLSPPGKGAHPRGMAIDLTLCAPDGAALDMGTAFDAMPENGAGPGPDTNHAHRDTPHITDEARANRERLTRYMMDGAMRSAQFLMPLPQEWWDYRLMPMVYDRYAPLSDADLPVQMRMTDRCAEPPRTPDFSPAHFKTMRDGILRAIGA